MNNVICAIAKNENDYIKEWAEYHFNLGFDHIYIYDNSIDSEHALYHDFQDDRLTYVPIYGVKEQMLQIKCYNEFYHSHSFDWCAFIDLDEFIVLNKWTCINSFVLDKCFENVNVIRLNWHIMDDNDIIERNQNEPVVKTFTRFNKAHRYNLHGKEIVRGNLSNVEICSCHWCKINGVLPEQLMPDGKQTFGQVNGLHSCTEAYINHYMTKSLSEFVNKKLARGDACFANRNLDLDYYWDINKKTSEKINWLEKNGLWKS